MVARTAGTLRPYSTEFAQMFLISATGPVSRSGVKPRSCIMIRASTNMTSSTAARTRYGTPRLVSCAMKPPATDPSSMQAPPTTWPRAKTDSSIPSNLVAVSASTSQASVAPEKKV